MKKKNILLCVAIAMLSLLLTACGGGSKAPPTTAPAAPDGSADAASGDPKVTLVYAEVNPLDTIVGKTDSFFKEKVEELSGGSVTVDLQAAGVLGSENDVEQAVCICLYRAVFNSLATC